MFSTVRRGFWFAAALCLVIEALSLAPIVYMWNAFDRVLSSRSLITLVSLTVLIVGVYLFWSAMEWVRSRLMVRLSLRIDWELAAEVFDASFRRHAGRKLALQRRHHAPLVHVPLLRRRARALGRAHAVALLLLSRRPS